MANTSIFQVTFLVGIVHFSCTQESQLDLPPSTSHFYTNNLSFNINQLLLFITNINIFVSLELVLLYVQGKLWGVIQQSTVPNEKMQGFLDCTCSQQGVDCAPINQGGACFQPNTLKEHSSYALDLLHRIKNFCNLDIGVITTVDPCKFPFKKLERVSNSLF